MGIKFACHECGESLNIKSQLAGKRGKCPACGLRFRIPESDQPFSIPLDDGSASGNIVGNTEPQPALTNAVEPTSVAPTPNLEATPSVAKPTSQPEPPNSDDFDPLAEADAQWYVRPPNGGRYGPASGDTVRQWIREGRVTKTTLIWRDGWAQWRDCDEFIPEAFDSQESPSSQVLPPRVIVGVDSPIIDVGRTQAAMAGTGPTVGAGTAKEDTYLGAKKRRRSRQRATLISILAGVALILVVALVVALAWPR